MQCQWHCMLVLSSFCRHQRKERNNWLALDVKHKIHTSHSPLAVGATLQRWRQIKASIKRTEKRERRLHTAINISEWTQLLILFFVMFLVMSEKICNNHLNPCISLNFFISPACELYRLICTLIAFGYASEP